MYSSIRARCQDPALKAWQFTQAPPVTLANSFSSLATQRLSVFITHGSLLSLTISVLPPPSLAAASKVYRAFRATVVWRLPVAALQSSSAPCHRYATTSATPPLPHYHAVSPPLTRAIVPHFPLWVLAQPSPVIIQLKRKGESPAGRGDSGL